jgi:predicted RecA/RadA family phage recombinase
MAYAVNHLLTKSFVAAEEIEAYRLVIVDPTDDYKCRYPEGDADTQLLGITAHHAESGEQVDVVMMGIALLDVDATTDIAVGDAIVAVSTAGKGQLCPTTAATQFECIGFALTAATAAAERIPVLISKHVETVPA